MNHFELLALASVASTAMVGCVLPDYAEGGLGSSVPSGGSTAAGGAGATNSSLATGGRSSGATASGGAAASGGRVGGGTSSTSGGTLAVTGGTAGTTAGGVSPSGGTSPTGGVQASGGIANTGGTSASSAVTTGGRFTTGGAVTTGGRSATGGAVTTGGRFTTGGTVSTGGARATGGTTSIGGGVSTGGSSATPTGGAGPATGGAATGGAATGGAATGGAATGGACFQGGTGGTNGLLGCNTGANPCARGWFTGEPLIVGADTTQEWFLWSLSAGTWLTWQTVLYAGDTVQQLGIFTSVANGESAGTFELALYDDIGGGAGPGTLLSKTAQLQSKGADNVCTNNVTVTGAVDANFAVTKNGFYWLAVLVRSSNGIVTIGGNTGSRPPTLCAPATSWPNPAPPGDLSCIPANLGTYKGAIPFLFAVVAR